MSRIYVCHTFYHAYVAYLKELEIRRNLFLQDATANKEEVNKDAVNLDAKNTGDAQDKATLMLSTMSNDFGDFFMRAIKSSLWKNVIMFDERKPEDFEQLKDLKKDKGNLFLNLIQRIKYTSLLSKLEEAYIPVDFKKYDDIYVFCDSDPIGYYLNKHRIRYHAMEDGLNCLVHFDAAHYDNRGHFNLKAFLSKKLGLIFIQNGYGKYCIDMEVNDISAIKEPCKYYKEVRRKDLVDALTDEDKEIILNSFVKNKEDVDKKLYTKSSKKKTLILTEPLCDLETRKRLFGDILKVYKEKGDIFIKPHPRDNLDYENVFEKEVIFDKQMPMEMLNFFKDIHFDYVVTVYTDLAGIDYAGKKVRLGNTFMDNYEDKSAHIQNTVEKDDILGED